MQYELKTQVIEPLRPTFDSLVARYGNKPASRYLEGTVDIQPMENFHYRPTWAPDKELYDADYTVFKLTDPYSFLDPRQYFYQTYVTARAGMHEVFGKTLDYVSDHHLFDRTPQAWMDLIGRIVIPLRHYESGCQMLYSAAARFSYGASISEVCSFESFDRIGNAQLISRVGITMGEQTATVLKAAKASWMGDGAWQPLRRLVEELLVQPDWAVGVLGSDLVDRLLDTLIYRHLDEEAIVGGAGAYSLLAQHIGTWYGEHRRWLDHLTSIWFADETYGEANLAAAAQIVTTWMPRAVEAVAAIAAASDAIVPTGASDAVAAKASELASEFKASGLSVDVTP